MTLQVWTFGLSLACVFQIGALFPFSFSSSNKKRSKDGRSYRPSLIAPSAPHPVCTSQAFRRLPRGVPDQTALWRDTINSEITNSAAASHAITKWPPSPFAWACNHRRAWSWRWRKDGGKRVFEPTAKFTTALLLLGGFIWNLSLSHGLSIPNQLALDGLRGTGSLLTAGANLNNR